MLKEALWEYKISQSVHYIYFWVRELIHSRNKILCTCSITFSHECF